MSLGGLLGDAYNGAKKIAAAVGGDAEQLGLDSLKAGYSPFGLAKDFVLNGVHDNYHVNAMIDDSVKAFGTRFGQLLKPVSDIAADIGAPDPLNAYANLYKYETSRPLSTLFLFGQKDVGYNPFKAMHESEHISPGNAIQSRLFGNLPGVGGHSAFAQNFDITDPDQRSLANHGVGRILPGSIDGAVSFFGDPAVIAGKGIKAVRAAKVTQPIVRGERVVPTFTSPATGRDITLAGAITPTPRVTDLSEAADRGRVHEVTDAITALPPNSPERALALANIRAFRGSAPLQALLNRAPDADAVRQVVKGWIDPSVANDLQLNEAIAGADREMSRIRESYIPSLQRALADTRAAIARGETVSGYTSADLRRELTDARASLGAADKARQVLALHRDVSGTAEFVPRLTRGDLRDQANNWHVYQPGRYNYATRILRSATTMRVTTVDLNRPGSAVQAGRTILDRLGHGAGRGVRGTEGMDIATKGALIKSLQDAELGGPEAVKNALKSVEQAAFQWHADRNGWDVEFTKGVLEAFQNRRSNVNKGYQNEISRFSGVLRDDGSHLDEMTDPQTGDKYVAPLVSSDLVDRVPMLDIDALVQAVKLHADDLSDSDRLNLLASMRGEGEGILPLTPMATELLEKFNRMWKPAQLLRLGWPIRVVTDENLRIIATMSLMTHLPILSASVGNFVKQSPLAYRARDLATLRQRRAAKGLLSELEPAHKENVERLSTVEKIQARDLELADLNKSIPVAGNALRDAVDALTEATSGIPLYRNAPAAARHATGGRGTTFTVDEGYPYGPGAGQVQHRRYGTPDYEKVYTTIARDRDPGIAALRDMLPADEMVRLHDMPLEKLRATVKRELGEDLAPSLRTRDQMLSAYGHGMIRKSGFHAILHNPRTPMARPRSLFVDSDAGHTMGVQRYTTAVKPGTNPSAHLVTNTPFDATRDTLSRADATRAAKKVGAQAPDRIMTLDELRTWVGATGDPAVAARLDAEVTHLLRARGYDSIVARTATGDTTIAALRREAIHNISSEVTGQVLPARTAAPETTYTALHPEGLRAVDDAPLQERVDHLADKLARLHDRHTRVTAERDTLAGRNSARPAWSEDMDYDWSQAMVKAVKPSQARKLYGPKRVFSDDVTIHLGGGRTIAMPDAFKGEIGRIFYNMSSSGSAFDSIFGNYDKALNGLRLAVGDVSTILPIPKEGANPDEVRAHGIEYTKGFERAANQQLGSNPVARKIMEQATNDEIVKWLHDDPIGRDERARMLPRSHNPHRWVEEVRQQVETYLPTQGLRDLALSPNGIRAQSLYDAIPEHDKRPMIHGESVDLVLGNGRVHNFMSNLVTNMYRYLGTLPTDTLSRHPYFANVYRTSLQRQVEGLNLAPTDIVTPAMQDKMVRRARQEALGKVRNVLYDVSQETHLGHAMRFVSPFYNAWAEAFRVWGKIVLDDPSVLARGMMLYNAPARAGLVYTDPNGNEQIVVPMPRWFQDHVPGAQNVHQIGIPAQFLQSLIYQGKYGFAPSAGPVVTAPLSAMARSQPDLATALEPLLPYGVGKGVLDNILPNDIKMVVNKIKGGESTAYVNDAVRIAQDLETDRALGKNHMGDDELLAEADRRAKSFETLRVASAFTMPFSPSFKSPYQFYIDQARTMRNQYTAMPNGKDPAGKTWSEAYLDKYGQEYFAFTQSATKSNVGGIAPTSEGFRATQKYQDLIRAHPQWGGLIVGPEDDGAFNDAVFQWQQRTQIGGGDTTHMRESRDPKQALIDQQTAQGWDMFRQVNTAIDTVLSERGLRSINQKGAQDLANMKRAAVDAIKTKFPAWGDPQNKNGYDTFTKGTADALVHFLEHGAKGGGSVIDDPRFTGRPGFKTLGEYLAVRNAMVNVLNERARAGGSANLTALQNQDLSRAWDLAVGTLKLNDTAFADLYDRWLGNDRLESAA